MKTFCLYFLLFFFAKNFTFGQVKSYLLPTVSLISETIKYNYNFSTTELRMRREASGISAGLSGMLAWNEKFSTSLGVLYNQTSGINQLTSNSGTFYSGSTPIITGPKEISYRDVNKSLQIPLLFDYEIIDYGKFRPALTLGATYVHYFKKQRLLFYVPEDKFPIYMSFAGGFHYVPDRRTTFLIQAFLNYDFFKTEYFSNYRVSQFGLQVRVKRN